MKTFEKCKLYAVVSGTNSIYGNPSYYLTFKDSHGELNRAKTASNSKAGYIASNYYYCESGSPIYLCYHITKNGNYIIDEIKHQHPYDAKKEAEDVL